jgi:hypothetical protein
MYNPNTDLIFPPRAIHSLAEERTPVWQDLVQMVETAEQNSLEQTAFILVMARMSSCATCNSDSFRALNGCSVCARQSIKRYRGSDEDLVELFDTAKDEVERYMEKKGLNE